MVWVKGSPRRETVLPRIDRVSIGRYSVRQPVESRGARSAALASGPMLGESQSRIGNSAGSFAICSPLQAKLHPGENRRQAGVAGLLLAFPEPASACAPPLAESCSQIVHLADDPA